MSEIEYVTACLPCAQGFYAECLDPETREDGLIVPCGHSHVPEASSGGNGGRDGVLDPERVTDPISTGRKRAAMIAPIMRGMLCEWAGLRHAGGGVIPMVGCAGNRIVNAKKAEDDLLPGHLHHGPDKAVLNNAPGTNLHRICVVCHNRWHALNDPFYDKRGNAAEQFLPLEPYYLHDANTTAELEEQELVEVWWKIDKKDRPEYPIKPEGLRKIAT